MTTTPQVRLTALYRNSGARSSGKKESSSLTLAAQIAGQIGMVRTWPNIQTIRLAIESEADLSSVSIVEAADVILAAAKEWSRGTQYSCPSPWEQREIYRENSVDRFWFEDARWRTKYAYLQFVSKLKQESA